MSAAIREDVKSKHLYLSNTYGLEEESDAIKGFYAVCLEHLILASARDRFESINHTKLMILTALEVSPSKRVLSNYEIALAHDLGKGLTWLAASVTDDILRIKAADYYRKYPNYGPLRSGKTFNLYSQGVVFELLDIVEYLENMLPTPAYQIGEASKKRYFQEINHETARIAESLDSGILAKFREYKDISSYLKYVLTGSLKQGVEDVVH